MIYGNRIFSFFQWNHTWRRSLLHKMNRCALGIALTFANALLHLHTVIPQVLAWSSKTIHNSETSHLIYSCQGPTGYSWNSKTRKVYSQWGGDIPWHTEWSLFMLGPDLQSPERAQCPCLNPFRFPSWLITATWNLCFEQAQTFFSPQPNNHKLVWLLPLH